MVLDSGSEQNLGSQKRGKKFLTCESDISTICLDAPTGAIALNFGMRGDIADMTVLMLIGSGVSEF